MQEWVERYQADKVAATSELMTMIVRVRSCGRPVQQGGAGWVVAWRVAGERTT